MIDYSSIHFYVVLDPYMFKKIDIRIIIIPIFFIYNIFHVYQNLWWAYINKPP